MDNDLKNALLDSFKFNLISYGNNLEDYLFNFRNDILEISGLPYYNKYKKLPKLNLESISNFKEINRIKSFSTPVYYNATCESGKIRKIKIKTNYLVPIDMSRNF